MSQAGKDWELYRKSSLGISLTESLDELVQNNSITSQLSESTQRQFDKVASSQFGQHFSRYAACGSAIVDVHVSHVSFGSLLCSR